MTGPEETPAPLGWCAWHLASDEHVAGITVYDGAALCAECHDDSIRQDGEHEETPREARRRSGRMDQ